MDIPLTQGLADDQADVERELRDIVLDQAKADLLYNKMPDALHGKVINIDIYRDLHPAYSADGMDRRRRRTYYTPATYRPAKEAARDRYLRSLSEGGQKVVMIMGGGPASGKSTSVRSVAQSVHDEAHVVYDTSLSNPVDARQNVQLALDRGHAVQVVWVHRPFHRAIADMVGRACRDGRYLTLERMCGLHRGSREAILSVFNKHRKNTRVRIQIIHNNHEECDPTAQTMNDGHLASLEAELKIPSTSGVTLDAAHSAYDEFCRSEELSADLRQAIDTRRQG